MRLNLQSVSKTLVTLILLSPFAATAQQSMTASRYFVIQNIATEKTRVYERSLVPGTPHTMIFETDIVVGRPEEGNGIDPKAFITWLGHTRIADWVKFYSDRAGNFPSWYIAGQDLNTIPAPISTSPSKVFGAKKWTVPGKNGEPTTYGAFGWYAARLNPAGEEGANYQWIHGTIGWGVDEDKSIEMTRGFFINAFKNPGSRGCTHVENRGIAYLRHLLPVGTDIYRVYARESTREPEERGGVFKHKVITPLPRYADKFNNPGVWEYILLTDGAQQLNGLTADAATVRGSGVSILEGVNFIEQGFLNLDQYPTAAPLDYTNSATSGKSGDRYEIDTGRVTDASYFRGYFLVDEGRFIDYQHPNEMEVEGKVRISGLAEFRTMVPEFLKTTGTHYIPAAKYRGRDSVD